MRILIVNDYAEMGGAEVVARVSADALRARGHSVEFFTADQAGIPRTPLSFIDSRQARRALRRVLAEFTPDVVHLHNFYHLLSPGILATLARWKRGGNRPADRRTDRRAAGPPDRQHDQHSDAHTARRVVMTLHDYHLICPNAGLRRFTRRGPRLADPARLGSFAHIATSTWDHRGIAHSGAKAIQHLWNYRIHGRRGVIDTAIAPSRFMASVTEKALKAERRGVPALRVVPNPLQLGSLLGTRGVSGDTPAHGEPYTLLFAGRVEPEKGLPAFVRALAGLPGVRFEIVGDGTELPACIAAGASAGVDVVTRGQLPHRDAVERIARSNAVVLPSVWPENAPVCLFEALALRRPILVSDAGGMREIVDDFRIGTRFDPFNQAGIRDAVERVRTTRIADTEWDRVAARLADRAPDAYAERLERIYRGDA